MNPGWVESFCAVRAFVRTESGNSKVFGSQESKKAKKTNTNYIKKLLKRVKRSITFYHFLDDESMSGEGGGM